MVARWPLADVHVRQSSYEGRPVGHVGGRRRQTGALSRHRQQRDRRRVLTRRPRRCLRLGRERREQRVRPFVPRERRTQVASVTGGGATPAFGGGREGGVLRERQRGGDERGTYDTV